MSFDLNQFKYIINTVDNLLSMSDSLSLINISTAYGVSNKDKEAIFVELSFPLRNGMVKITMFDSNGFFSYINKNGEILENIEFSDNYIGQINSCFDIALKQIRDFDRQHSAQSKEVHVSVDRASFGLSTVN